jgi:2-oxoglutarate ferredoxin oxidoreductase subunit alpha
MTTNDLTIAMVGSGGDGVVTMGDLIAQVAASEGLHAIKTEAYGPQIRGGEASCTVRVAAGEIFAQGDEVDVLVVFRWADFKRFRGEISLARDVVILVEAEDPTPPADMISDQTGLSIPVPFAALARESAGSAASKNVVALGVLAGLFGLPEEGLRRAVTHRFGRKKESVREANTKAFEAGVALAKSLPENPAVRRLAYVPGAPLLLMSGNEASAVGALHAGCRFFAGYPITPSTEILQFLAEWMPRAGGSVIQTEDELSAIGAVIGASFAGVKSMTATSGPGLSLMTEMLGLSSMAEVPIVIVDVQRGGPSTGNPTKGEQSDLFQCLYGTHGDAPRVVLACSRRECSTRRCASTSRRNSAPSESCPTRRSASGQTLSVPQSPSTSGRPHDGGPTATNATATPDWVADERAPHGTACTRPTALSTTTGSPNSLYRHHEKMNAKRYRKLADPGYHFSPSAGARRRGIVAGVFGGWSASRGRRQRARESLRVRQRSPFPKALIYPSHVGEPLVVEPPHTAQFCVTVHRTFPTRRHKRSGAVLRSQDEGNPEAQ